MCRGSPTEEYPRHLSENSVFVALIGQVYIEKGKTTGLKPSPTQVSRLGRPFESHNYHTGQSSLIVPS